LDYVDPVITIGEIGISSRIAAQRSACMWKLLQHFHSPREDLHTVHG
jgi:hypothetical protein